MPGAGDVLLIREGTQHPNGDLWDTLGYIC